MKKRKRAKNKEELLPVIFIGGGIIFIILACLLILTFNFKKEQKLHYVEKSNLDYKVYLKDNDFYDTPYLGKDMKYVSSLIDYVDADFDYSFSSADNFDLKYSYYIVADLQVNSSDGTNIYSKKYTLLDETPVKSSDKNFSISENVKIDYSKYNTLARQFIRQYSITAESKLVVSLYVDLEGTHENIEKDIKDQGVVTLNIPLLGSVNDISMDYVLTNNKDAVLKYNKSFISNIPLFCTIILLMIIDIIFVVFNVLKITNSRDATTLYQLKLNKIKKEYDRYLSETILSQKLDDLYKTKSLRVILIKSFEGLLDVRDNLKKPILYHEEFVNVETIFYIIADNIVYIYVMHVNNFRKKGFLSRNNPDEEIEILLD